jgi:hypothetical protein
MTQETQVKFGLWPILVFLFLAGMSSFTFLYAEGKETKVKQQEVIARVVVLETNYTNIMRGLDKLTEAVEKSVDKLEEHRMRTENGVRKTVKGKE